jgi:DNA-binding NtrC family response regulator
MPRILVVDDEPEIRDLLRRFFTRKQYTVLTAESGAECLATLDRDEVDAVVLDLAMPGMSGMEVLSEIRAKQPDLPVVMVTGITDEELAKETLRQGAFDYVMKPMNFDYLERTLYIKLAEKLL